MRCFIAVELPDNIRKELDNTAKKLSTLSTLTNAKLKLVKSENLHLTLRFLGELSDVQVKKAKEALKTINYKSFDVQLEEIGIFPSPSYIRIVWAGLEPKEEFIKMHNLIDRELAKAGFKEDKRFESHITLARVKFVKDKAAFLKHLESIKIKPLSFAVNSFILKKSTLTREGPIYEDIVRFTLTDN